MTTYAALLEGVAQQIRVGAEPLRTDRFWTANQALDMIGDFHAVLDAIAAHTRRLLWPAQVRRIGLSSYREGLPPIERAAIALAAGIEDLVGAPRPHPSQLAPATTPWRDAAHRLRAASDLVATHFEPDGRPRTPDAVGTDPKALDAGLVDLGHLTERILAAEEPLALRAVQAGVHKTAIVRQLPGLGRLRDLARDMSTIEDQDPAARARLEVLRQTWTPIRTDDPIDELADRMHRLRQATFDMSAEPGTLATLRDVTTIGIAVHVHTAAFHGARVTASADPGAGTHGAGALILRGRAWQRLHRELSRFVTLAPPSADVRDDLVALAQLLPELAPLETPTVAATLGDRASRRIGAGLNGAVATMTGIGDHSARGFSRLSHAGELQMDARDLPRSLVSEHPELAECRLQGGIVRAPEIVVDTVREAFATVREDPIRTSAASPLVGPLAASPRLGAEPLEFVTSPPSS